MTRHQRQRATQLRRNAERIHWRDLEWTRRQFCHLADDSEPPDDPFPYEPDPDYLAKLHFEQRLLHRRL